MVGRSIRTADRHREDDAQGYLESHPFLERSKRPLSYVEDDLELPILFLPVLPPAPRAASLTDQGPGFAENSQSPARISYGTGGKRNT